MGKGLEWYIILELMLYASANWVPVALPLSILMASIMTFGSLGEHNELIAMKSSGMSLFKIMKPLMVLVGCIAVFAFYFSNNLWPMANFKMRVLISDIQNTKVALALQPGVFFKSDNFSIRVKEKGEENNNFKDILIYDHSDMQKQTLGAWSYKKDPRDYKRIIRAKSGRIVHSSKKSKLQLELESGVIIQEWNPTKMNDSKLPFSRYYFDSASFNFDLNSFDFERSNEDAYQKEQYLLSVNQILLLEDSVFTEVKNRKTNLDKYVKNSFSPFRLLDSTQNNRTIVVKDSCYNLLANKTANQRKMNVKKAIRRTDQVINHINIEVQKERATENYLNDMSIEWNRKFTLSYAVLMLFFLGAPLGAIVKKGGLGWPVLVAILFFLVYFIFTRAGEEMAANGSLDPIAGMWLSAIIITPITLFIFYKSNKDSRLFDYEFYLSTLKSIFAKKFQ